MVVGTMAKAFCEESWLSRGQTNLRVVSVKVAAPRRMHIVIAREVLTAFSIEEPRAEMAAPRRSTPARTTSSARLSWPRISRAPSTRLASTCRT